MRNGKRSQHMFIGLLCALGGAVCVSIFWFIKEEHEGYGKRWGVLLFGVMMLVVSFQFLKESFRRHLSSELDELLNSTARTIFYGGFGALAVSGAVGRGSEVRGGLPFVPDGVNMGLGRVLFGAVGIALCGVGLYCLVQTLISLKKYFAARAV